MKTQSPASVACCAAFLIMTVPLMARAASRTLVLTDAEPQYSKELCWAAADVLAVNQFYPNCPRPTSSPPATPALFPTSQLLEAAYNKCDMSGDDTSSLSHFLWEICEPRLGNCNDWNRWGFPPLHGLTFKWGKDFPDPLGLDWNTMTQEIDAGHPVLFVWNYLSDGANPRSDGTSPSSPVGEHELVVIGYSDDTGTQQLQIWDPWPVPDQLVTQVVPACGPASGVEVGPNHSQWIDFSTYRTPVKDMGVSVTALHCKDQWGLAAAPDAPVPTVDTCVLPKPKPPAPPSCDKLPQALSGELPQPSFAKALSVALPQSRQLDLLVSGAAPRSLGVPFPIVGLGFQQLLRGQDNPTALLSGTTSAILFPVESHGEVVDAFLMLFVENRWQRGGYANVEITRRLVDVRARYAAQKHLPVDGFYMVSVPGEVAFFAAYGKGKQAILIPASTDPTIDAFAGVAVPAERQLKELILAIQRDLLRHPDLGRNPVRPGQE